MRVISPWRSEGSLSDPEMFLLRSDGNVWYFRPHETRSKLYGRVRAGVLESRYTGRNEVRLRSINDADAILPGPAPSSSRRPT